MRLAVDEINDASETRLVENNFTHKTFEVVTATVFSTAEDIQQFNNWYYKELTKKSNRRSLHNLNETRYDIFKCKLLTNSSCLPKSNTDQH